MTIVHTTKFVVSQCVRCAGAGGLGVYSSGMVHSSVLQGSFNYSFTWCYVQYILWSTKPSGGPDSPAAHLGDPWPMFLLFRRDTPDAQTRSDGPWVEAAELSGTSERWYAG